MLIFFQDCYIKVVLKTSIRLVLFVRIQVVVIVFTIVYLYCRGVFALCEELLADDGDDDERGLVQVHSLQLPVGRLKVTYSGNKGLVIGKYGWDLGLI